MITQGLEENIRFLRADARRRRLSLITVEHLTLVLIEQNVEVREMLVDCHADVAGVKAKLNDYLASRVPVMEGRGGEPKPSPEFQRVLQRALSRTGKKIGGTHVLAAVFAEPESSAAYYLQKYGIERLTVMSHLFRQSEEAGEPKRRKTRKTDDNLVELATAGELERPLGREAETLDMVRVLSRKYKNNVLLVGEPGVGKTSLVHALAYRVAEQAVPEALADLRIVPVSVTDLIAGTKYRGEFEQRIKQLMEKCRTYGNVAVFIDEIHTLIGSGAVTGGTLDAANIIKPLLMQGDIRYIGATTFNEYRRYFERDGALSRRFHRLTVREPEDGVLRVILDGVVERLGGHHQVGFAAEATTAAMEASRRYFPAAALPDKAIDLLDDAGAACRLGIVEGEAVGREEVFFVARRTAEVPAADDDGEREGLGRLLTRLTEAVFDQAAAAERLANAVLCRRLGFDDGERTVGAFLFTGPTGVGKTEMARTLARVLAAPLLRYDMSEYMERHAVSRLIGSPPGYVGYEQNGRLTEDVFRHPGAVILFDEVEKAHPDVLNVLLQVFDYGCLSDNSGRVVDFSHTLVILTSNVGAVERDRGASGFDRHDAEAIGEDAVRRFFSPELRNRLDAVVPFAALGAATFERIVRHDLAAIRERLAERKGVSVAFGRGLRAALVHDGMALNMGARPLKRLIRERVLEPLARAAAVGALADGARVRLEWDGEGTAVEPAVSRARARVESA